MQAFLKRPKCVRKLKNIAAICSRDKASSLIPIMPPPSTRNQRKALLVAIRPLIRRRLTRQHAPPADCNPSLCMPMTMLFHRWLRRKESAHSKAPMQYCKTPPACLPMAVLIKPLNICSNIWPHTRNARPGCGFICWIYYRKKANSKSLIWSLPTAENIST